MPLPDFLQTGLLRATYETIRVVFIIADIALIGGIIFAFIKGLRYRPRFHLRPPSTSRRRPTIRTAIFRERWMMAEKRFSLGTPDAMRRAIIEADAIADSALKSMGIPGEHMADRLEKISEEEVKSLGNLWHSHRARNNLVHTPGYEVEPDEARRVFEGYRAFLHEIKIL